jgi:hypothetical protein
VPGTSALNKGGDAEVNPVSCASAGRCAANGSYIDGSWNQQYVPCGASAIPGVAKISDDSVGAGRPAAI